MQIEKVTTATLPALAELAAALWPTDDSAMLAAEFKSLLTEPEAALLLATVHRVPAGFAQWQLRHDYVEGTTSSPVGYLEGIYVTPSQRQKGIGLALVSAGEEWARTQGCQECGSDCPLTNTVSAAFHQRAGFTVAARLICFTKSL